MQTKFELDSNRYIEDPMIVDAVLTDASIQELAQVNEDIKSKFRHIKYVFVSPLRRTVQTAIHALAGYPNILEWHAAPWAREILKSQCDLGYYSSEYLSQYPFIDRSQMTDSRVWFMDFYDRSHDTDDNHGRLLASYKANPTIHTLVTYLRNAQNGIESPKQMEYRVDKFKQQLVSFIADKSQSGITVNDGEILVVSHSRFISHMVGRIKFDESGTLLQYDHPHNSQILEYELAIDSSN